MDDFPDGAFDFARMREEMVTSQLVARGIDDKNVLRVMGGIAREKFVQPIDIDESYEDHPLGIACRQTISQPYIVALMSQMLQVQPEMKILEIGTGSGYQAAVLSALGAEVFSVERHELLSHTAELALKDCGLRERVHLKIADGSIGWNENAPYDRIILTCCAPHDPGLLLEQLADGGQMLAPVETGYTQVLRLYHKENGTVKHTDHEEVIFVKLVGQDGYKQE